MPKPTKPKAEFYLGIDPGLNGGIAAIDKRGEVFYTEMPSTYQGILDTLNEYEPSETSACIEWINPGMFGIHKSSMSKLYGSYQALQMALTAIGWSPLYDLAFEIVQPKKWQEAVGIKPRKKGTSQPQWKESLRVICKKKFPKLLLWDQTKKRQLQCCDAILIAEYCRKTHKGK